MFPCMPPRRHFWRTLQLQWLFLEDVPCFARETCQEEPSKLLGTGDESRHSQRCKISEALSLTARYSQCWELSQALSLKPQAYLIKTYIAYIRQNMQQNLNSWCIKQIIRPHCAISTCCTVLSISYLHAPRKQIICLKNPTGSSDSSLFVWTEFLESSRQDTDKETSCNLFVGKTVWKRSWKQHPCQ